MEVWKDIKGFEGHYQVSDLGRVKSLTREVKMGSMVCTRKGRILKEGTHKKGYKFVILQRENLKVCKKIHRLVAENFIPNPNNLPCVNHIDKNKNNNLVTNLEWCTNQYNIEYSQAKTVILKSPSGEYVKITNISKFCRENGVTNSNLTKVINGTRKSCCGWTL